MNENTLVELTKVNAPFEAHALRGFLESHNIPCFIADEHLGNMMLHVPATSVRLNVRECDLDEAKALLETL